MEVLMPQIGDFMHTTSGFAGRLRTLTLETDIAIVNECPSDSANTPDYCVHLGSDDGPVIGAAWNRTGDRASAFIALSIEDPSFAQPIRANLFRDDDAGQIWSLHWKRPSRRKARG
jgi:uncharacterized protein (DUF736 family)